VVAPAALVRRDGLEELEELAELEELEDASRQLPAEELGQLQGVQELRQL